MATTAVCCQSIAPKAKPQNPSRAFFFKQLILDFLLSESLSNLGALGNTPSQAGGWVLLLCLSKETVVTCVWETSLPWERLHPKLYKTVPDRPRDILLVLFSYASTETLCSNPKRFPSNCIFLPVFIFIIGRVGWSFNLKGRGGGDNSIRGNSSGRMRGKVKRSYTILEQQQLKWQQQELATRASQRLTAKGL